MSNAEETPAEEAPASTDPDSQPPPYDLPSLPSYSRGRYNSSTSTSHRSRRRGIFKFKRKEMNLPAALCNMLVIVVLCTALAETRWLYTSGGGCKLKNELGVMEPMHYLGANQFLSPGYFTFTSSSTTKHTMYRCSVGVMEDCVSVLMVNIMKVILLLTFLSILSAFIAFLADLTGPTRRVIKVPRRNAVFSIITVVMCVVVIGLAYWFSDELYALQHSTRSHSTSRSLVTFSVSIYLISAAAGLSILASALNLLKKHGSSSSCCRRSRGRSSSSRIPPDRAQLLEDTDGPAFYPPPPPYTPIPNQQV